MSEDSRSHKDLEYDANSQESDDDISLSESFAQDPRPRVDSLADSEDDRNGANVYYRHEERYSSYSGNGAKVDQRFYLMDD